jgi:RIO kinase 1
MNKILQDMEVAKKLQEEEDSFLVAQKLQEDEDTLYELQQKQKKNNETMKFKIITKNTLQSLVMDDVSDMTYTDDIYEDEEEDEDENYQKFQEGGLSGPQSLKKFQPATNKMMKHSGKIQLEGKSVQVSQHAKSELNKIQAKSETSKVRHKGKEDRATVEQVMDPRTRMILFKLMNTEFLQSIDGCVSTGKEANVYHAAGKNDEEYAIKIFKTSILIFKDRDRYVNGEFRFRKGYAKSNPRKMVALWAEKEMRNLKRLKQAGIRVPEVYLLRQHVLIMEFIGKGGWPAQRLKDVKLESEKIQEIYLDMVKILRNMFIHGKLVHGDFSDYNILYHKGKLYIIDVSQSVEHDHPHALEFLRKGKIQTLLSFRLSKLF